MIITTVGLGLGEGGSAAAVPARGKPPRGKALQLLRAGQNGRYRGAGYCVAHFRTKVSIRIVRGAIGAPFDCFSRQGFFSVVARIGVDKVVSSCLSSADRTVINWERFFCYEKSNTWRENGANEHLFDGCC